MTLEHKIVVGLNDIKAVIFECRQCHTRVSMSPDDIRIPTKCPKEDCAVWIGSEPAIVTTPYEATTSKYLNFVQAIGHIRKSNNGAAFRILLEFDDSKPTA